MNTYLLTYWPTTPLNSQPEHQSQESQVLLRLCFCGRWTSLGWNWGGPDPEGRRRLWHRVLFFPLLCGRPVCNRHYFRLWHRWWSRCFNSLLPGRIWLRLWRRGDLAERLRVQHRVARRTWFFPYPSHLLRRWFGLHGDDPGGLWQILQVWGRGHGNLYRGNCEGTANDWTQPLL